MKNLNLIDKILFIANSISALVLLVSFSSYYISPQTIAFISVISLCVPVLILINLAFVVYWLIKLKRQFLLSTIVLIIGFQYVSSFYCFTEKKNFLADDIKIMSYNVRLFNMFKWINEDNVEEKMYKFIDSISPDILCIQEYKISDKNSFKYPYNYIDVREKNELLGYAIFSNYEIINTGSLNFSKTGNNAIYADIVKNSDTIRVYNTHLQSLSINPKKEELTTKNTERLRVRVEKAFKIQTKQVNLILENQKSINYKTVICGDFNNTAFSWAYKQLKNNKNDAFEVAGKGFGRTYDFSFPLRIDFILADERIRINYFKTFEEKYSDHYPIMARLNLNKSN